jgi:DNA invertase Pin-like site-specific DNA recombinase
MRSVCWASSRTGCQPAHDRPRRRHHRKLVFTTLSAVAEAERDRIRERITDVKRDQPARGKFLGGIPPYGFERDGRSGLVPIPEKEVFIARMVAYRERGESLRKIQERLHAEGEHVSLMSIDRAIKSRQAQTAAVNRRALGKVG